VVVILMTPTYLQKVYAVTPTHALQANSLAIIALTLGCIVAGRLIDRLGSGLTFMGGSLLLAWSSWNFYTGLQSGTDQLLVNYALAGFCVGIVGAVPYVMVNAFPAAVRFSGLSFSYNVAYAIFGGLTPMLVTLWLAQDVLAPAYYVVSLCGLGFCIGGYLWWRQRSALRLQAEVA
jgi:MFS family permease